MMLIVYKMISKVHEGIVEVAIKIFGLVIGQLGAVRMRTAGLLRRVAGAPATNNARCYFMCVFMW